LQITEVENDIIACLNNMLDKNMPIPRIGDRHKDKRRK